MRALITGARGQLGSELLATAPRKLEVVPCDRSVLDITDLKAVRRVLDLQRPQLILNAAAYTAVDRAESEPDVAFQVNAMGVGILAEWAAENGARLVHVSTDFVFAGDHPTPRAPEDPTLPLSVYGRSKLEGERLALQATAGRCLIFRTAWLYSQRNHNFVHRMLDLMARKDRVAVVADQIGSPTWARGLAEAIWRSVELDQMQGIHHWTDAGVASWFDFAVAIHDEALLLGLLKRATEVTPVGTADFPTSARRPAFSVLDKSSTWEALGVKAPHWRRQLRRMLLEIGDHHAS